MFKAHLIEILADNVSNLKQILSTLSNQKTLQRSRSFNTSVCITISCNFKIATSFCGKTKDAKILCEKLSKFTEHCHSKSDC